MNFTAGKYPVGALAVAWSLAASMAYADIVMLPPEAGRMVAIGIVGEIKGGDLEALARALPPLEAKFRSPMTDTPMVTIRLNTVGGDLIEAEKIGRLIRSHSLYTQVDKTSVCASACVFILAAGVQRFVLAGAKVALHRPYFEPTYFAGMTAQSAMQTYNSMLGDTRKYLAEMNAPDGLFRAMVNIPSQDARVLSERDITLLGLRGIDPAWQEFFEASRTKSLGPEAAERLRYCEKTGVATPEQLTACMRGP